MEFHMRKSRVLRQMRAGKVAVCAKLNLSDPRGAEIAAMCGFDNEYYFSNFMKKQTGMSPSVFRTMKY